MEHAGGRLLSVHSLWAVPCGQHRSGFRGFDYLYFFCILLDIKLPALFVFEQVARKIRPRCMCWGFWRSWLWRFLSAQWSLAVRLFFVWWPWVMWWEDITIFSCFQGMVLYTMTLLYGNMELYTSLFFLLSLCSKLVTACAMQAFHKLFSGKPNPSSMSAELNAQIITVSLTHMQPHTRWYSSRALLYLFNATYCFNLNCSFC